MPETQPIKDKSYAVTLVLCILFGYFGAHRFYAGKAGTGLLMLFTLGGVGIWWFIDFVLILTRSFSDSLGRNITP